MRGSAVHYGLAVLIPVLIEAARAGALQRMRDALPPGDRPEQVAVGQRERRQPAGIVLPDGGCSRQRVVGRLRPPRRIAVPLDGRSASEQNAGTEQSHVRHPDPPRNRDQPSEPCDRVHAAPGDDADHQDLAREAMPGGGGLEAVPVTHHRGRPVRQPCGDSGADPKHHQPDRGPHTFRVDDKPDRDAEHQRQLGAPGERKSGLHSEHRYDSGCDRAPNASVRAHDSHGKDHGEHRQHPLGVPVPER